MEEIPESEEVRKKVQRGVADLTARFTLYPKRLKQTAQPPARWSRIEGCKQKELAENCP
jgi:hypothetical protein